MGCLGILLPILGLLGFYYGIDWLFYLAGGISALLDVFALIGGQLRCFGTIFTILFWVTGYKITGSVLDGLIWGSCISSVVMVIGTFVFVTFTTGIGAAIAGLVGVFEWMKGLFGKK